jgi:hypothetical protein
LERVSEMTTAATHSARPHWADDTARPALAVVEPARDVKQRLTQQCAGKPGGQQCTAQIVKNSTGLCRRCWLDPAVRPRKRFASSETPDQIANAMHLLRVAARGAHDADPSAGLGVLIDAHAQLAQLIHDVGVSLVAQVGPSVVARELGITRQAAQQRWGK